jgi:hypothetical protein
MRGQTLNNSARYTDQNSALGAHVLIFAILFTAYVAFKTLFFDYKLTFLPLSA